MFLRCHSGADYMSRAGRKTVSKGNPNPSPENRFKPGIGGNPSGRPKRIFPWKEEMTFQLTEVDANDPLKRTHGRILIEKQIQQAKNGSIRAAEFIFDRLFGKPVQSILTADLTPEDTDAAIAQFRDIVQRNRDRIAAERARQEAAENGNGGTETIQ